MNDAVDAHDGFAEAGRIHQIADHDLCGATLEHLSFAVVVAEQRAHGYAAAVEFRYNQARVPAGSTDRQHLHADLPGDRS
ncbi:MAG: hypothetical protein WA374_07090 [Acidobacteriaceae bacterium]